MTALGLWTRWCPTLFVGCLLLAGCTSAGSGSKTDAGACEDGAEGCACYGNGTCNEGLTCLSKYCVDPDAEEDDEKPARDDSDGNDSGGAAGDESPADDRDDAPSDAADDPGDELPDDDSVADDSNDEVSDPPGTADETDEPTGDNSNDDAAQTDVPSDTDDDPASSADDSADPTTDDASSLDASVSSDDGVPSDDLVTDDPSPDETSEPVTDDTVSDDATDDAMTDDATDPPPPTGNLIKNGTFAAGTDYWSIDVLDVVFDLAGGSLCMTGPPDSYVYGPVGFPLDALDAFSLQAGKTYRLQYEVWISDEVGGHSESMNVKVGQAVEPYAPVITWDVQISDAHATYTNEFVADGDYSQVGVVFLIETAVKEMCFDNVSFVALD